MQRRCQRLARVFAATAALVVVTGLAPPAARAANNATWSVAPTGTNGITPRDWYEYELRAGQTLRDMVSVSNLTGAPMTFRLYPADAYNTPIDGAFALTASAAKTKDAGSWIHLGYSTLNVPPRSRADVAFEIDVPADATPGDHAAGIVAEDAAPTATQSVHGRGVVIRQRVGTRVYIRVAGPLRPALAVTRMGVRHHDPLLPPFTGHGQAEIAYQITNTGNVRLSGSAVVTVKDVFGRTLKTYKARDFVQLLPKGSVVFAEKWAGLPIVDRVSANVTVDADGTTTTGSHSFWKIPWLEVLILLLAIGLAWGGRRYRRGRSARPLPPAPKPAPAEAVLV